MMALPILRCSCNVSRPPSLLCLLFKSNALVQNRINVTRTIPLASVVSTVRKYSSDRGGEKQNQKVVVVGIPNPFIWFRTRIYYFLIRTYFDKEFNIEDFTEGAKQVSANKRQQGFNSLTTSVVKAV